MNSNHIDIMIAKVIKAFYDKVIATDYVRNTNDVDIMRDDINAIIDKLKVIDVPEKIHTIMDGPLMTVDELQDEFVFFSILKMISYIISRDDPYRLFDYLYK